MTQIASLLYHHVGPVRNESCKGLTVTPEAFARQMGALAAIGYTAVTPAEWARATRENTELSARSFILTFDDCYADLTEYALPILSKHSFNATVFVPTALIGGTIKCSPSDPSAEMAIMSRSEIADWSRRGLSFGAHSRTHVDLTTLGQGDLESEVRGSCGDLAEITGKQPDSFAYPYGRVDTRVRAYVQNVFETAFTIEEGLNDFATPLHSLRRTMVQHNDTVVDVCLRVRFGTSVMQALRSSIRSTPPGPAS